MPQKYGTHEQAALVVLTARNREVFNTELTKDHGIELRPAGRDRLNRAGLIESWQENRRYVHRITDAGAEWCEVELAAVEAPPRSGPLVRALLELVLRQLVIHLQRDGRIVDLLHPADLEALIRIAYHQLSAKPQDWVRLAKLRPKLDGADKSEVDQTLMEMTRTGLVHLAPESARRSLTEADHDAAVRVGGEDNHLVAIEES